jgi:DNA-binding MarR family transcriptional regulator
MPRSERTLGDRRTEVAPSVADLEVGVSTLAHLLTRTRRHEWTRATSGVPLDRAAMVVLRQLDNSGSMRLSELAVTLEVENPHITRQVHILEQRGYAKRSPDPNDKRAQLIELTDAGSEAAERLRITSRTGIQDALAHWSSKDLEKLADLLHRMVDDFMAHTPDPATTMSSGVT